MNNDWQNYPIYQRADSSFIITIDGSTQCIVSNEGNYTELYVEISKYIRDNPNKVQAEPATGLNINPYADYEFIDGEWIRVRYTKKAFMLWCGVEKIAALNAIKASGNVMVETVKDLLMAADYIDIQDPDTIQMINLLATPMGGNIMTVDDVTRILSGEPYLRD